MESQGDSYSQILCRFRQRFISIDLGGRARVIADLITAYPRDLYEVVSESSDVFARAGVTCVDLGAALEAAHELLSPEVRELAGGDFRSNQFYAVTLLAYERVWTRHVRSTRTTVQEVQDRFEEGIYHGDCSLFRVSNASIVDTYATSVCMPNDDFSQGRELSRATLEGFFQNVSVYSPERVAILFSKLAFHAYGKCHLGTLQSIRQIGFPAALLSAQAFGPIPVVHWIGETN